MRAAVDIKIFVSGTGQLPNEEWAKQAAKYRLGNKNVLSEGIALGLVPNPVSVSENPFSVSENR